MEWKLDIEFIAGGQSLCGSWWTMEAGALDLCFKLYYVVAGGARMQFGDEIYELQAERLYFINGYKLSRQWCDDYMDVFWVHFNPQSINPRILSSALPALSNWAIREIGADSFKSGVEDIYCCRKSGLAAIAADCRMRSTANDVLARLLGRCDEIKFRSWSAAFARIRPAIDHMDAHFTDNPPLEELAAIANLTANYFHRAFKKILGVTPYEYMLKKRLNTAKHLLTTTDKPVAEIAEITGYENSYYFSRTFRKNTGKTPSQVRKNSPV
jgi:AraC family transcriptional regulator